MDQIDDPSSSAINNNNDYIEVDEESAHNLESAPAGPQSVLESRLDMNETEGSLWRYFFKPENPAQTKVKCRICSKEICRGKDQSTSSPLAHLESQHKKFHGLLKQAKLVETIIFASPYVNFCGR